jgi:heme exporter protein D
MNWGSWDNFWAMGGYGGYVWGAYAMVIVLLVIEFATLRMRSRRARSAVRRGRR